MNMDLHLSQSKTSNEPAERPRKERESDGAEEVGEKVCDEDEQETGRWRGQNVV